MALRSELSIHHIIALLLRSVLKRLPDCAGVQKLNSFCIIDDAKQREKITEELCLAVKNKVKTAAGTHGCRGTEIPVI